MNNVLTGESAAAGFTYATGDRPLEGYTIKHGIGQGGFGEVYYAVSDGGKEVALKVIQRHLDVELRGVRQCLNLKHPHLLTVYDVKRANNGEYWIVMEYVSGRSLAQLLADKPSGLHPTLVRRLLRDICKGLDYLHNHGIAHRDMKPGNIFFHQNRVIIGDYGLAKYISASRRIGQTESVGTVHYMAPEVSRGRYGKEIDLYALGVIVYEMLTGCVPFDGQSPGEILMKHLTAKPDLSALPELYRPVVARLLAKEPTKRYKSAQAVLDDLDPLKAPAAGEQVHLRTKVPRPDKKLGTVPTGAMFTAVAVTCVYTLIYFGVTMNTLKDWHRARHQLRNVGYERYFCWWTWTVWKPHPVAISDLDVDYQAFLLISVALFPVVSPLVGRVVSECTHSMNQEISNLFHFKDCQWSTVERFMTGVFWPIFLLWMPFQLIAIVFGAVYRRHWSEADN